MEKVFVAKVIHLGRITIPKELREFLGIGEGDFVEMKILGVHKTKEAGS